MTKTYHVGFVASTYTEVEVEAEDRDEAIEKAYAVEKPYSCHHCPQIEEWVYESEFQVIMSRDYYEGVREA